MKIDQPPSPFGRLSLKKRSILFGVVILIWYFFSDLSCKILGLVLALFFSFLEFSWYSMTIENSAGDVIFKPFDPNCRKGHTVY